MHCLQSTIIWCLLTVFRYHEWRLVVRSGTAEANAVRLAHEQFAIETKPWEEDPFFAVYRTGTRLLSLAARDLELAEDSILVMRVFQDLQWAKQLTYGFSHQIKELKECIEEMRRLFELTLPPPSPEPTESDAKALRRSRRKPKSPPCKGAVNQCSRP